MVTTAHPHNDQDETIQSKDSTSKSAFDVETSDDHESESSDDTRFIEINEYIKLDLKSNVLVSSDKIDSGTRILIELPLFKIPCPQQSSHPANSLFLYHSFLNHVKKDLRREILCNKFPLKKLNPNIAKHTANLKSLLKKKNKLNKQSVVRYSDQQWKELEVLQNIFHQYSISLQMLSDPYQVVYDHYNGVRFNSKGGGDDDEKCGKSKMSSKLGNGKSKKCKGKSDKRKGKRSGFVHVNDGNGGRTNIHGSDADHVVHLGKALYERASHLLHSCNPCCRVNVIDEKGTVEVRTLVDIPHENIPLTRNFLDDTRGLGISLHEEDAFCRLLMNDDINLIPCNMRCKSLLLNYHFVCECPQCKDWDRTRGILCSSTSQSGGCKGILLSRPPYLRWQCASCDRVVNKASLQRVFELEKAFTNRLRGIEEVINYQIRSIDVDALLYPLLNECSQWLSQCHWIVQRLLWICFEEKLSRNHLPHALIYLKRHIEGCEQINDYGRNPSIVMANKYELIADLLPYEELYKQEAIKKAMLVLALLNGEGHSSVKRCKRKYKFYAMKYQQQ